ncbi:MAG: hypothetical protein H0U53_06540 [Actinobacteria bacterium]|nr:hypothetical protein [Actinomycetota bacterium]
MPWKLTVAGDRAAPALAPPIAQHQKKIERWLAGLSPDVMQSSTKQIGWNRDGDGLDVCNSEQVR